MQKRKPLTIAIVIALVLIPLFAQSVYATPERFLIRSYRIDIEVESMETALPRILTLPGIDLYSAFDMYGGTGQMVRLVANHELEPALMALRGLGNVTATSTFARNEFASFNRLHSELRIRTAEYDNLLALLNEAEALSEFRVIERRIVTVIAELEGLRGSINHLNSEMGSANIHITIRTMPEEIEEYEEYEEEYEEEEEEPEEYGTFARIGNAFTNSARFTLSVLQAILLVATYASIPMAAILIGAGIFRSVWRKKNKTKGGKENDKA